MCRGGAIIGVFGHVALGIVTRKFLYDAASKVVDRPTALVDCSKMDTELVGFLSAFGGILSLLSLDDGESSVVKECKGKGWEEVAADDTDEGYVGSGLGRWGSKPGVRSC